MKLEDAFIAACEQEICALKPGNVHVHAAGHRMTVEDFRRSAHAAAAPLCKSGMPLGARVLGAVRATRAAVGQNTNLGILLLAAPLIMAAEAGDCSGAGMGAVLDAATTRDTADVFAAITLASPAGLGEAPDHDVRGPATAPLWLVMQRAAERDRIAAQYASGFDAVFQLGLPAYRSARARWGDPHWATSAAYYPLSRNRAGQPHPAQVRTGRGKPGAEGGHCSRERALGGWPSGRADRALACLGRRSEAPWDQSRHLRRSDCGNHPGRALRNELAPARLR